MKPCTMILASAGSGKTHRLTRHFIEIIRQGVKHDDPQVVERILAATFTRAAAGEIAQRILKRLAEAALDPSERRQLSDEIADGCDLTDDDCIKLLQAVVRRLNRLRICTLDSFLVRSAQCFAPELGLSCPWTILDDQANRLLSLEAVDGILEVAARTPEQFEAMLGLLIQLNQLKLPLYVRERLVEHFDETYDLLLAGPAHAWEAIDGDRSRIIAQPAMGALADELPRRVAPFLPLTQKKQPNGNWIKAIANIAQSLIDQQWENAAKSGVIAAIMEDATYYKLPVPDGIRAALMPVIDHLRAHFLTMVHDRNVSTRDLLTRFDVGYRKAKARRSAYRFSDFTSLLIDAEVVKADVLADFYYRLDGNIDHILLDEFQDTSIAQWTLMQPLVDEIIAGGEGARPNAGGSRSFLCVGDVKQTLYGWRNAEPKLVDELRQRWPQLETEPLVESFRSSQVIIDAVNEVFGSLTANFALPQDEPHFADAAGEWERWFQSHTTRRTELSGFVHVNTCARADTAAEMQLNALRTAAQRVAQLHAQMPGADIAILLRRKKFIARMIFELSRLGIESSGEGGNPLIDDAAVCAALSMLHLIDHPSDTAAVYHVGHSPLGAVLNVKHDADKNDILKVTGELRKQIMDRGIGKVLNGWLGRIAPSCNARNLRRFKQLIELAHHYPYDGSDLTTFVQYVREKRVEDVAPHRVRVMTIHASKGRQFDAVVLPDLDSRLCGGSASVLIDRDHLLEPLTCISMAHNETVRQFDERLQRMDRTWRTRQVVEELCALYVAMTRAKQGLEMIVHPIEAGKDLGKTHAGVVCAALGAMPTGENEQIWQHNDSMTFTAAAATPDSNSKPADPPAVPVRIVPPGAQSRIRAQVSPSSLEGGGYISLKSALDFKSRSRERGTSIHRCFEHVCWLDADDAPSDQRLHEALADLAAAERKEIIDGFRKSCGKPNLAGLLRRSSYTISPGDTLEVWRERNFFVKDMDADAREVILTGQFDRVVLTRRAGRFVAAEIIGFKSDRVGSNKKERDEAKERYRPQIHAYRRAVARMTGLDPTQITAKLFFLDADAIEEIAAM